MIIKANRVDIRSHSVVPVSMEIEEGVIVSITEIEEECSTYILPGFIDAHIHIESSMLIPSEFARLAVRHGTVATVCDPHEIANVLGMAGVEFMIKNGEESGFKFYFGASPCVPATPFETSGAILDTDAVRTLLANPKIKFLSEVMNFPGVLSGDPDMLQKIEAARTIGKPVDGHAPGLQGEELERYIAAGITTDHEAFTYEEGREKLEKGMKIIIREGSAAKNFDALHPLIEYFYDDLMFCSDDAHPDDLLQGHINTMVRRAIQEGHNLFHVLQIACINPILHYGLDVGMLRPGDPADFIEVADLSEFAIVRTFIDGKIVADIKESLLPQLTVAAVNNFHTTLKCAEDFAAPCCENTEVIQAIDHELITHEMQAHLYCSKDHSFGDPEHDILKITVINRYEDTAPAVAYVNGFGLKKGAIASSVAHDSHNIIAVGCSDEEIAAAVNLIITSQGGISAVEGDNHKVLPLDIAGIMSSHDAFEVAEAYNFLSRYVTETLGSSLSSPFMTLSFMALLVIPELKLSDKGLFDGRSFHFIHPCKI
ncbi:MAG: adenine deaminase [Sulfuricurvum sp.]|jgi:adenine deaminase|uniref:adenine deaminase n=1 Tax=Sulfuricurvum sp. TaxID=2025608 RepID=UPI0025E21FC9|nr:adenine deaminase [Sulfuricurvum sp.]MCK9372338.1 adenine deaminase [Sulfuricurvum sp.]